MNCRSEILHSLGLPESPSLIDDTDEGGALAFRAQFSHSELVDAGKFNAAAGWIAKLFQTSRRYAPPWPERRKRELISLWHMGYSTTELAAVFDICPAAVRSALKRNGVVNLRRWPRWREDEDRLLRDLLNQGSSCEETANLLHRTPLAVAGRARKLGMKEFANRWLLSRYPRHK